MSFWDLEEGGQGGLNGATGIVTTSYFKEGEYGWSLFVDTLFDDPENYPKFEGGTFGRHFALGKDWSSTDGGQTAVHTSGDTTKRFRNDSGIGRLVAQLAKIGLAEQRPEFNPYQAASFAGLHLEWENVPVPKRAPKVDEAGNRVLDAQGKEIWEEVEGATLLLPVRLVGDPAANGHAEFDVNTLGLDTPTLDALSTLAKEKGDADFMVAVATTYGSNKELMAAVTKDTAGTRQALADAII